MASSAKATIVRSSHATDQSAAFADDARWMAVTQRDHDADGQFVYAVTSTGVFCRPSCASRRPLRHNVVFFAKSDDAIDAGFRACLRCHPDRDQGGTKTREAIIKACRALEQDVEDISLDDIAALSGMSRSHFQRTFKAMMGVTPRAYFSAKRAERTRALLKNARTATQAAFDAGFNSMSRFYADAKEQLGMAPHIWRKNGVGETIRFAIGVCSLGHVLVGATPRGVCTITIADDPHALLQDFQEQFSRAELIGDDAGFSQTLTSVIALIEQPARGLNLPLDIAGTLFQQKVWAALRAIPPGTTLSYAELAERIGAPQSVRAVARACASNRIAVAIPCHRIVRSDGDLSGYRWGIARKAELLKRERVGTGKARRDDPASR